MKWRFSDGSSDTNIEIFTLLVLLDLAISDILCDLTCKLKPDTLFGIGLELLELVRLGGCVVVESQTNVQD